MKLKISNWRNFSWENRAMKNKSLKIGKKTVGEKHPVFVIAEAGVNHNGDIKIAKKLIDVAQEVGADAVKFQTFDPAMLATENAPKALYQDPSRKESQQAMLSRLALSEENFKELKKYAEQKNIIFLSTPFGEKEALFLHKLNLDAFKIGSGDANNIPLLTLVGSFNKPIILSTGMMTLQDISESVTALKKINKEIVLLHCTSSYPTPPDQVNLKSMVTIQKKFNCIVGLSDHSEGIEAVIGAVALGASIIEKHITLDKTMEGPDHGTSLEPEEFKKMVHGIRIIEQALGNDKKLITQSEKEIIAVARKSVVALRDIQKGSKITKNDIVLKRPGTGIEPKFFSKIIGTKTKQDIKKDTLLSWKMLGK